MPNKIKRTRKKTHALITKNFFLSILASSKHYGILQTFKVHFLACFYLEQLLLKITKKNKSRKKIKMKCAWIDIKWLKSDHYFIIVLIKVIMTFEKNRRVSVALIKRKIINHFLRTHHNGYITYFEYIKRRSKKEKEKTKRKNMKHSFKLFSSFQNRKNILILWRFINSKNVCVENRVAENGSEKIEVRC